MRRRDLLAAGGLTLAGLGSAAAQDAPGLYAGGWSSLLHVWTDADGVSHAEHLVISKDVKPVPVTQMSIRPETHGFVDWHNSRFPAFVITIEGNLEVEVSDGTRLALPPSKVAFLEDNNGKGHITRTRDVVNLFIAVTPGFDVRKWASGQA
jgi:quercetin dioxygenase-like cupin family protein